MAPRALITCALVLVACGGETVETHLAPRSAPRSTAPAMKPPRPATRSPAPPAFYAGQQFRLRSRLRLAHGLPGQQPAVETTQESVYRVRITAVDQGLITCEVALEQERTTTRDGERSKVHEPPASKQPVVLTCRADQLASLAAPRGFDWLQPWLPTDALNGSRERWSRDDVVQVAGVEVPVRRTWHAQRNGGELRAVRLEASGQSAPVGSTDVRLDVVASGTTQLRSLPSGGVDLVALDLDCRWTAQGGPGDDAESRVRLEIEREELEKSS